MNNPNDLVLKIGITPSNAPFRISCLRTFLYINAIAEKNHSSYISPFQVSWAEALYTLEQESLGLNTYRI